MTNNDGIYDSMTEEQKQRFERVRFGGACNSVVEDDLRGSLKFASETEYVRYLDTLYSEYVSDGKPKKLKQWIRQRLAPIFISADEPPRWLEDIPNWPWLNGKPMVFLDQMTVPDNEITKSHATANTELYVFGLRVPSSGGWKMEYRVIEQRCDLKGVVALVESELPPHTPANTKLVKRKDV
jgi:hypothetical protein